MLFFVGGKIILGAIDRLIHPVTPDITMQSLIVLLSTLCINIFVSVFELKRGRKLKSQILVSDSMHTRSDIYVSIGVLATLIGIRLGLPTVIDSVTSLIVSAFILYATYRIFQVTSLNIITSVDLINKSMLHRWIRFNWQLFYTLKKAVQIFLLYVQIRNYAVLQKMRV